jgi:hypothetical protein
MLAAGVLTSRNIGWPKGPFPLPDFPCALARDSMERQRGHIPLALSERNPSSGKQNGALVGDDRPLPSWYLPLKLCTWLSYA